jgi:hypothetical protein
MKKYNLITLFSIVLLFTSCAGTSDWRNATKESAKIAPEPSVEREAIVYVFAAKTVSWRGIFSVHSWVAFKEKNAPSYTTLHVIGWRVNRGLPAVVVKNDIPDRYWYGAKPEVVFMIKGTEAELMIPQISRAVASYPYANKYHAWPGPNSNTFISHILRNVSGMTVELPPNAIGKDYLVSDFFFSRSETKTGGQFSLYGVFGLTLGLNEGIELNILGLNFGIDLKNPALKLPLIGRVGMQDSP